MLESRSDERGSSSLRRALNHARVFDEIINSNRSV